MRPTRDASNMSHALVAAQRGTCYRLKVGAVVVRDGRILVTGYNGTPAGMPHCDHRCTCGHSHMDMPHIRYRGGAHDPRCLEVAPCTQAVHAEENCIAYAAKWGIALDQAEMFSTDSPCLKCSHLIINSGITRFVYAREYRLTQGLDLLSAAGVEIVRFAPEELDPL